jgi:hypothetical protein
MGSTTTPWEEGGRTRVLGFTQLPGRDNDIKQWTIDDLGFEIQDFTTDPVQDLLAIIEDRRVSEWVTLPLDLFRLMKAAY